MPMLSVFISIMLVWCAAYAAAEEIHWINEMNQLSMWCGHADFAMWLAGVHKPSMVVDLGVDLGISTFSFSCGLLANNLPGQIVAIDNFGGFFDASAERNTYDFVMSVLKEYELNNVEVIVGDFYKVRKEWTRGTVDLLHIDGGHEYVNVKKETGIILFHDICPVVDGFGVAQFFSEISVYEFKYKGYFRKNSGLGVATNNQAMFQQIVDKYPEEFVVGNAELTCRDEVKIHHTSFNTFRKWLRQFPVIRSMGFMATWMPQIEAGIAELEEAERGAAAIQGANIQIDGGATSKPSIAANKITVSAAPNTVFTEKDAISTIEDPALAGLTWNDLITAVSSRFAATKKEMMEKLLLMRIRQLSKVNYIPMTLQWMSSLSPYCTVGYFAACESNCIANSKLDSFEISVAKQCISQALALQELLLTKVGGGEVDTLDTSGSERLVRRPRSLSSMTKEQLLANKGYVEI